MPHQPRRDKTIGVTYEKFFFASYLRECYGFTRTVARSRSTLMFEFVPAFTRTTPAPSVSTFSFTGAPFSETAQTYVVCGE